MWSYLRNLRFKQTNLADLQFLSNYALFFKKLVQKVVKGGASLWSSFEWSTVRKFSEGLALSIGPSQRAQREVIYFPYVNGKNEKRP